VLIPGLGDTEAAVAALAVLDGLLLTGGPDVHPARFGQEVHPGCERIDEARDATELALIEHAQRHALPILGICRGVQMLNVAFGGTLFQDLELERPGSLDHRASNPASPRTAHPITIKPGSKLARALGAESIPANSLHHQALDTVARGFVVNAQAPDGVIEGIEHAGLPFVLGVQCHPEHLYAQDARWLGLFRALVAAAARRREERTVRSA
jgi:putative glutamine amidotransferase